MPEAVDDFSAEEFPKLLLLLLYTNPRRKHLQRFYGTSSSLEARMLVATCCCGNRTVCKHFTVSLGPAKETPPAERVTL